MPTISEIRNKYPQYNDLSDQQLANNLHQKFYSDMPVEDFYKKIEFSPNEKKSVTNDKDYLKQLIVGSSPGKQLEAFTMGAGKGGENIASTLTGGRSPRVMEDVSKMIGYEPKGIENLFETSGQYAPSMALAPSGLLSQILVGGGYGALQNPEHPVYGAAEGAALPFSLNLAGKALQGKLTPSNVLSKLVKSPLSEQELLRNLEVSKGTKTGLGDIIGSPNLKFIQENILSKVPFSGATKSLSETGSNILNQGENIVKRYLGENEPIDVTSKLGDSLINAKKIHTDIKNSLYNKVDEEAEKQGFLLKTPNFSDKLRENIDDLISGNVFQYDPKIRKIMIDLSKGSNIRYLSVKEANIMASHLHNLAEENNTVNNRGAARVLFDLSRTLKNDVKDEIKNSGHKELNSLFNEAEKNYSENYSDFLDKDIYKFTSGKKSPDDLVSTFLKTSNTSDKADQLDKLLKVLPKEDHDLIKYSYFSRAMEGPEDMKVVNPNKLSTLWKKLGDRQKRSLIPDENERRELDNFSRIVGMNQKAINKMWNPATGQMNLDVITAMMMSHPLSFIKEIAGSRIANKALTSEGFREKVVKRLIERQGKNK